MQGSLIVIGGPTASGKSALAVELAKHYEAEIINADSRQFYKGMDIGTAKATEAERAGIPHHFLDFLNPDEAYSAGRFEQDVLSFLSDYFTRKGTAIAVGGSGLYLQSITHGMDDLPSDPDVREKWNAVFEQHGLQKLQEEVRQQDPGYFAQADIQNPRRLIRALEVMELSGRSFSSLRKKAVGERPFQILPVALLPERSQLYRRIDARVDEMINHGLVSEAENLLPYRNFPALKTVGYQELFNYFDGAWDMETTISKIKQHTRNYAKRQYTWFRRQEGFASFAEPDILHITRHLEAQFSV